MNLKFWKKKAPATENADSPQEIENDKTVAMEVPDLDSPAKQGLLTRVKSGFSGLLRRFKKTPAPGPENAASDQASEAQESEETPEEDNPLLRPMRTKKRLIVGGAIALSILLLAGAGFATWKIFLSPPKHDSTEHAAPATAEASHDSPPEEHAEAQTAPEAPHSELEDLRKKNEELQAQIETLKKEQKQDQSAAADAGNEATPSSGRDEMTISNKDPKAAAQSLREAIEAMNAGTGGSARKPAK